ncbi:hypothetical protein ACLMJK_007682 [Lecanora helva]
MEYLPRGNLEEENQEAALTMEESLLLLRQGLQGLQHLHDHGYAYRDIKPSNILVQSREPFHIKITDYGLSKRHNDLKTFCGTNGYLAPEVKRNKRFSKRYTAAVDIWSLGVVILQYGYGSFPRNVQWQTSKSILNAVNDLDSNPLSDLLSTKMLKQDPRKRLSAKQCFLEASAIPLKALRIQTSLVPAVAAVKTRSGAS